MRIGLVLSLFLVGWFGIHGDTLIQDDISDPEGWHPPGWVDSEVARGREIVVLSTSLLCAAVGILLRRRTVGRVMLLSVLAGAMNGAFALAAVERSCSPAIIFGVPFGICLSFFYVPFIWVLVAAAALGGRASAVGGHRRRALWRALQIVLIVIAVMQHLTGQFRGGLITTLSSAFAAAVVACLVGLLVLVADAHAAWSLQKLGRAPLQRYDVSRHGPLPSRWTDVGVGEDFFVEIAASAAPYREQDTVIRVVHGDLPAARKILQRALLLDAAVLAAAVAIAWWLH